MNFHHQSQSGNILFVILIAVVLIGLLTAAVVNSGGNENANIDRESLMIKASEFQRYGSELERAVRYVIQNGVSESDIRFSFIGASNAYGDLSVDTDTSDQVFAREGGGALYRDPPERVNDGSPWEFYGGTALPSVGSARADLIAVLPNVSLQFCNAINELNGQSSLPLDTGIGSPGGLSAGDCLYMGTGEGRFGDSEQFYITPNTVNESTFAQDANTSAPRPALQACVQCARDNAYHAYHVLMAR